MKSLVLLDADVVIFLHQFGLWQGILKTHTIHVASTVISEVKFFEDATGNLIPINLRTYVYQGVIQELSLTAEEIAELFEILRFAPPLDGINAGELESIGLLHFKKCEGLKIVIEDGLAVMALSFLELDDKAIPLPTLIESFGHQAKARAAHFSKERFRKLIADGKFLQLKRPD
jgi:hypothetical protein